METITDGSTVTFDLYKDIHKAIRAELFDVTRTAGTTDPGADDDRVALAERVARLVRLLVSHAEHEDAHMQDLIVRHVPLLGQRVEAEHVALDARMLGLGTLANAAADARTGAPARGRLHDLYLELASFTSAYLDHIDMEERQIMPALCSVMPVPALLDVHQAIVGSIPPPEMAESLALMLPAQNVDDRTELLGGMQAGAPPEVFAGVVGLARSVLAARDFDAVATRLGVTASA